jgi:hypothetical protein
VIIQVAGGPLGVDLSASPDEICRGDQSVLNAQGLGGTENYTYSWVSVPPGFNSDLSSVTVEPLTTTQYTITINDGLSEISESVTVTVDPNPVSDAGPDIIIPYGTFTNLSGTGSGGSGNYSYHWEPASFVLNPDSANTQTVNLMISTIFNLVITDMVTGCISESNEVIVQVSGGPLGVIVNSDNSAICKGDTATLTAYASGGNQGNYNYYWTDNLGNSYPPTQQITVSPPDTAVFNVTINDGFNQIGGSYTLIVFPSAEFTWPGGQEIIMACPYDSVMLKPVPQPSAWSYLWSNGSVDDEISIKATGIGFSAQTYTLSAKTPDGCEFSRSITVIFDFGYCFGIDEEYQESRIRVIPNPNNGKFRVLWSDPGDFIQILMYSPLGEEVFSKSIPGGNHETDIDLPSLPAGLYILCLRGSSLVITRKVIVRL